MKRRNFLIASAASVAATALPIELQAEQHCVGRSYPVIQFDKRRISNIKEIFGGKLFEASGKRSPWNDEEITIRCVWAWLRKENGILKHNADNDLLVHYGPIELTQQKIKLSYHPSLSEWAHIQYTDISDISSCLTERVNNDHYATNSCSCYEFTSNDTMPYSQVVIM